MMFAPSSGLLKYCLDKVHNDRIENDIEMAIANGAPLSQLCLESVEGTTVRRLVRFHNNGEREVLHTYKIELEGVGWAV